MSDYPKRLLIGKCHPFNGGNFYVSQTGLEKNPGEYIRADLCITRAQLDAANAKLALHESENVTRGLLIDRLQAQADAAAGQMRERCIRECAETAIEALLFADTHGEQVCHRLSDIIRALPLHEEPNNDAR